MDVRKRYDIHFKGLGAGEHRFSFDIDDKFFAAFEASEIRGGEAVADVVLTKTGSLMTLDFTIKGYAAVECDRCLEECRLPVDYRETLNVRFSDRIADSEGEYDGEVLWMNTSESVINVAQYIYESIVLSLPYQRVHPDGPDGKPGCNPEMLERFSIVSEEEFEQLVAEPEMQKMAENPEWEKLRKLKEQME